MIKGQANTLGIRGQRDNVIRRAFGGRIADHEEIVVVVYHFGRGGKPLAQRRSYGADQLGHRRVELGDEGVDVFRRRDHTHTPSKKPSLTCRSLSNDRSPAPSSPK